VTICALFLGVSRRVVPPQRQ